MTQPNPRSLTDQELLAAHRLLPWEHRLSRLTWSGPGCAVVLIVPLLLWGIYHMLMPAGFARGWYLAGVGLVAFVGFPLSVLLFVGLDAFAERRRRVYERELRRRYAGAGMKTYIAQVEAEARASGGEGPDTVVIVEGASLPNGGDWLIRLQLYPDDAATVEKRTLRRCRRFSSNDDDLVFTATESKVAPRESRRARVLADHVKAAAPVWASTMVIDGAPASAVIWTRDRGITQVGGCNLCGILPDDEKRPNMQLMLLVARLGHR